MKEPEACIACGERHDGGYMVEDGPGPFCSQCWSALEREFAKPAESPGAAVDDVQADLDAWQAWQAQGKPRAAVGAVPSPLEQAGAVGGVPPPEPFQALLDDMRELERLYQTDRVAHVTARQIERIFDRWLYRSPDGRAGHE